MRCLSRFVSLFVLMFAVACTHADTQVTATDTGVDGLSPVYSDGVCHFRLKMVPGEGVKGSGKGYMFYANEIDNPVGWGFGWTCYAGESKEEIDYALHAKQVDHRWIWSDSGEPFVPAQRFKTYAIVGTNWTGRVAEFSDTTGEEVRRKRYFNFCLFQSGGPQILCGQVQESLRDEKLGSQFRKALAVIKTIVFVDSPAIESPAPDAPSSAH